MAKQASLLRCSKLTCYAEFNRMVSCMSRGTGEAVLQTYKMNSGNRAEYLFYTTLASLLGHVVHNEDPEDQKKELEEVYLWYCANKPLISTNTKQDHKKPKLYLTERCTRERRPHTAPALPLHDSVQSLRPSTTDHTHLYRPHYGFTTTFLRKSMDCPPLPPTIANTKTSDSLQETSSVKKRNTKHPPVSCVSVVEISSESTTGLCLSPNTLVQQAPVIAARMELQRELRLEERISDNVTPPPPPHFHSPKASPDHTSHSSTQKPTVHVLDLNLKPLPANPSRTDRQPSALQRSVGSGFKCSRYKVGKKEYK